jgi:hypothetical protein
MRIWQLYLPAVEVEKLRFPRTIKHLGKNAYYSNIGDAWTIYFNLG